MQKTRSAHRRAKISRRVTGFFIAMTKRNNLSIQKAKYAAILAQQKEADAKKKEKQERRASNRVQHDSDGVAQTLAADSTAATASTAVVPSSEPMSFVGKRKRSNSNAFANPVLLDAAAAHPNSRKVAVTEEPPAKRANSMQLDENADKSNKKRRTLIVSHHHHVR
jgi:hypothetical protein